MENSPNDSSTIYKNVFGFQCSAIHTYFIYRGLTAASKMTLRGIGLEGYRLCMEGNQRGKQHPLAFFSCDVTKAKSLTPNSPKTGNKSK